jgi:hypothetical protein
MFYSKLHKQLSQKTFSSYWFCSRKMIKHIMVMFLLGISVTFPRFAVSEEPQFQPLPYEDAANGRNSYAYNAAIGKPASDDERIAFLNKIKPYVLDAQKKTKIPACAIAGMAALESGFGSTRTAHFANNILGLKSHAEKDGSDNWQLKGQPDESGGYTKKECITKVERNYCGRDNKFCTQATIKKEKKKKPEDDKSCNQCIFDEQTRCDNRYLKFNDYEEAIQYLSQEYLQKKIYSDALKTYLKNRESGKSIPDSCNQYVDDIAKAGYTHIKGKYLPKVEPIMKKWDLYTWVEEANK